MLRNILLIIGFSVLAIPTFVQFKKDYRISSNVNFDSIPEAPVFEQWQVLSIHDGDTLKAQKDGIVQRIRFCGIDAPEVSQPLGKHSRDYLRSLISLNKFVQISIVDSDRYGRKIGEIFLASNGTEKFINEEMAKAGMAYSYDKYKNCPNQIAIQNGEAIAKSQKLGVWSGEFQKPWDYRKLRY
jgi:endonuclease YncB( thermonuclease family)